MYAVTQGIVKHALRDALGNVHRPGYHVKGHMEFHVLSSVATQGSLLFCIVFQMYIYISPYICRYRKIKLASCIHYTNYPLCSLCLTVVICDSGDESLMTPNVPFNTKPFC